MIAVNVLELFVPIWSWKVLELCGSFFIIWNTLVHSTSILLNFSISSVCSTSILWIFQTVWSVPFQSCGRNLFVPLHSWKCSECICLFLIAPEKFGILLFVPLCSWKVLELLCLFLFVLEMFWSASVSSPLLLIVLERLCSFLFVSNLFLFPYQTFHFLE